MGKQIKLHRNPFQIGSPIQYPAAFAGRKDAVREISHAMLALQNISLHGERRTGKTSLLLYLAHPESSVITGLSEDHIPVYYDFQEISGANITEVWMYLATAIAEQLKQRLPKGRSVSKGFLATVAKYSGPDKFFSFSTALSKLELNGLKIHLLFDEFERTMHNPNLGDDFYDALRSLPIRAKNVSYVIASRIGLEEVQPGTKKEPPIHDKPSSPFFNIFTNVTLPPFQEEEAYALIFDYFARAELGVPLPENLSLAERLCGESDFLYDLTGYHPFFLQTYCYHLAYKLDIQNWPLGQARQKALQAFKSDAYPHFKDYWKNSSKEEQELIWKLANNERIDWKAAEIRFLIANLENRCLVVQANNSETGWRLFSSAFGNSVMNNFVVNYVPNYRNDIFVSYAHVDNEALPGTDKGWVTNFVTTLEKKLAQKLGRTDAYSLWMDDASEQEPFKQIKPNVARELDDSATFLLILSPGYMASPRCRRELNRFLAGAGKNAGRIFVVERDWLEQRPEELRDLLGYKFWIKDDNDEIRILADPKPNPEELAYYQKIDDLVRCLLAQLEELKKQNDLRYLKTEEVQKTQKEPKMPVKKAVFLAEVSDDLEEYHNEVKRYLDQQGIQVLPKKTHIFSENISLSVDQDLQQCDLFVQLLSSSAGKGYPCLQYEQARKAELTILQWRNCDLDVQAVRDRNQRALLEESTVIAMDIIGFKAHILQQLGKQSKPEKTTPIPDLVFINATGEDRELAREIKHILDDHKIDNILPMEASEATKAAEIRGDLEKNLLYCDAVILIYGNSPVYWVRDQLRYCRYIHASRERPLKIIAVCNKPPSPYKPLPDIYFHTMQTEILQCPTLQDDTCLPWFIKALKR